MLKLFGQLNRVWRRSFLIQFAILAVLVFGSRSVIADWNYVPSGSMKPTILEGDAVFVNRMAYDIRIPFTRISLWHRDDPQRGEVVILYSPVDEQRLVKRVVAVPGDEIALFDGHLFINGRPLRYSGLDADVYAALPSDERYKHVFAEEILGDHPHPVMLSNDMHRQGDFAPVRLPADRYYVMGDNRDNSADSRYFGFVARDRIVGRAIGVLASFDQKRHYRPRWDRFFSTMP